MAQKTERPGVEPGRLERHHRICVINGPNCSIPHAPSVRSALDFTLASPWLSGTYGLGTAMRARWGRVQ